MPLPSPANDEPLWLTTKQTAKLLAISERTLYDVARRGGLDRVKIGPRALRYRRSDVLQFAAEFGSAA